MLFLFALAAQAADIPTLRKGLLEEAGWEQVAVKKHDAVGEITVHHKNIDGLDCVRGTAFTDQPPDVLLEVAADIPSGPAWSSWDLPESEYLSPKGPTFDYYQLLDNPFPINDRFWFLTGTIEEDALVWQHLDPTRYPERLARVRAEHEGAVLTVVNVGSWRFAPVDDKVRIEYRVCTDVGGSIPAWAQEFAAVRTMPTNIADLVIEARRRSTSRP